ncbi:hypothetical protein [Marinoscillum pacificum]|uniref:hypothetical protein n=1 Tax=Marinoscillum pacificum TaxID=392723 RepID=UPI002157BE9C|nr:hypothetical protein [Marinoscillum pacificum]
MKQNNTFSIAIILICSVWLAYSCSQDGSESITEPMIALESNDDLQNDPLNLMIAEYLGHDPEQSVTLLEEVEPWLNESITLEDSTAAAVLPTILGAKAVGFYTYEELTDGWKQYLLVANHAGYLSVLEGNLLELDGVEYEIDLQKGKKKPKKPKHPKPEKEDFGSRKGCNVFECTKNNNFCISVAHIPCGGAKSNCTTDSDCRGQTQGADADDVRGGIIDKGY